MVCLVCHRESGHREKEVAIQKLSLDPRSLTSGKGERRDHDSVARLGGLLLRAWHMCSLSLLSLSHTHVSLETWCLVKKTPHIFQ